MRHRSLSRSLGKAVLVVLTGTVIPQVTIKQMPDDLLVLDRMDVPRVFRKAPRRLTASQVELAPVRAGPAVNGLAVGESGGPPAPLTCNDPRWVGTGDWPSCQ